MVPPAKILIVCALECEAKPIIARLGLKKTSLLDAFQVFANKDTYLIITGVGNFKSAVATTAIITKLSTLNNSLNLISINIGICGATSAFQVGQTVFPHSITAPRHKKKYFQELLVKHNFTEVSLSSEDSPVNEASLLTTDCVDMESYGYFQAASTFLKTSEVYCVKVVSDNCCGNLLDKNTVSSLVDNNFTGIFDFYTRTVEFVVQPDIFSEDDKIKLKSLSSSLRLTEYQDIELEKLALSYKVRGNNELSVLDNFLALLPISKTEVKEAFTKIQSILNAQ